MHNAVRDDRLWFQRHPTAVVRFRKSVPGEFESLRECGEEPPAFRPSACKGTAPLSWVAVVDLMQLLGSTPDRDSTTPCARLRLRTPALRSSDHRQAAKQELMKAVATELLAQTAPEAWKPLPKASTSETTSELDSDQWLAA